MKSTLIRDIQHDNYRLVVAVSGFLRRECKKSTVGKDFRRKRNFIVITEPKGHDQQLN